MRPRLTGMSTVCQDASTTSGLRTSARQRNVANCGSSAANNALCLMSKAKRSDSGLSMSISPCSAWRRRRPPSASDATTLSSSRPPTWSDGARRCVAIRARVRAAKRSTTANASAPVAKPAKSARGIGSDRATTSGSSPARRQARELPDRGIPVSSHVSPGCRCAAGVGHGRHGPILSRCPLARGAMAPQYHR